jgi:hypothetical protein
MDRNPVQYMTKSRVEKQEAEQNMQKGNPEYMYNRPIRYYVINKIK